jgi:hypothetical protein
MEFYCVNRKNTVGHKGLEGREAARSGLRSKREGRNPRKARFFCPPKGKKMCQNDQFDRKKVSAAALHWDYCHNVISVLF